jgi:hypothetical protein
LTLFIRQAAVIVALLTLIARLLSPPLARRTSSPG